MMGSVTLPRYESMVVLCGSACSGCGQETAYPQNPPTPRSTALRPQTDQENLDSRLLEGLGDDVAVR